jgi:Lon-like ATP-dependent protease
MAPIQIPENFPNVPIISINRYPLFPGFIKKVDVSTLQLNLPVENSMIKIVNETSLKDLLRKKIKMRQPYVGVFVKKDDE